MTKQVQRRRGTASQHTSFTGAEGEISVNTTNKSVHVHDGVTAGGVEAARADLANVSDASLNTALAGNTLSSLTITSADINSGTIDGTVIGGTTPAAVTATSLTATGTTTLAGASTTADITFGDNDKAIFGAGSNLQIYNDGTHNYIEDTTTGNLYIQGTNLILKNQGGTENLADFVTNGAVNLYYDGAQKLATTSTGVDVTGTVTADGLTVDGNATVQTSNPKFTITNTAQRAYSLNVIGTSFYLKDESEAQNIIRIDEGGDISFYEDTGTTPKFFWDASAESLGIGTSSPASLLHLESDTPVITLRDTSAYSAGTGPYIQFQGLDSGSTNRVFGQIYGLSNGSNSGELAFYTRNSGSTAERMRIDASGMLNAYYGISVDGGTIKLDGNYPVGINNVALGDTALDAVISGGDGNTAIGSLALTDNTTGDSNTAVGYAALFDNSTASANTAVGASALEKTTTGADNSALGFAALLNNTTGSYNSAVGRQALRSNTTASNNTAVGYQAGYSQTTAGGGANTYLGHKTGYSGNGYQNVFAGYNAGYSATSNNNTFVGTTAGYYVTSGGRNTILGRYDGNQGGLDIRTSSNNIVLSDGDGNPRVVVNGSGRTTLGDASLANYFIDRLAVYGFVSGATQYGIVCSGNANSYSQTAVRFFDQDNATQVGSITFNTSSTAYNTTSDYRLKENVVELTGATERLKQIPVHRFNFIADPDRTVDGFLAHEVQAIVPEAIHGTKDEVDADGNPVYQGIDQSKLVPLLVATIKELEARIAALEAK